MSAIQEKRKPLGKAVKLILLILVFIVLALIAGRVIGYGNLGYAAGTIYRMLGGR